MSERHHEHVEHSGEHHRPVERHHEHEARHHERELTKTEKEHGTNEHVEKLTRHAEQHAVSGKELGHAEHESPQQHHPVLVNKQLKDMAFTRTMTRTRKKLSPVGRTFSKVIHNPVVDKSSELLGKTVARPVPMFWGAFFAFVGTSALLWITRHYGYEYNYLVAILLFVAGAVFGTALEGLWYLVRKKRSR